MPGAYSIDLRERVLAAYERGEGSQGAVARRFGVSERTVFGWLQTARAEGRRGPKPRGGGRAPAGGEAGLLAELVAEQGDATLAEYAGRLAARTGTRRSLAAICRALKRLGLVRKKPSERPSRSGRLSLKHAPLGAPRWARSTPRGWSSSTRAGSTPAWPGPTPARCAAGARPARSPGGTGAG